MLVNLLKSIQDVTHWNFTKECAVIKKTNQLYLYQYKHKMSKSMNVHTHTQQKIMLLPREIETLSFRSYTVRFPFAFKVLLSQMVDGTEPFNELLASDLPWGIIYQIKQFIN